jgi:hypothetical protein
MSFCAYEPGTVRALSQAVAAGMGQIERTAANALLQAADEIRNQTPYRLVIDDCQNFGTHVLDTILAESGKRELWLTLAHQFVSQLDERLWHSILSNCSTLISFRVGAEDAPIIGKAIDWNPNDLQNLGIGKARFVTLFHGKPSSATLMQTQRAALATGFLDRNVRVTRNRYARPRKLAEKKKYYYKKGVELAGA